MQDLWPWLVLAGTGALHGLNPAALAGMGALHRLAPATSGLPMPGAHGRCSALAPRVLAAIAASQLLWSSVASAGHGAGLMLMPALLPLCSGTSTASARPASGSLFQLAAAISVHCTAMLLSSGLVAALARRAWAFAARRSLSKTLQ